MATAQQFRGVVLSATVLSLVLATCWFGYLFIRAEGLLKGIPWAVFLSHALMCLLAWHSSRRPAPRWHRHLLVALAQMVVCAVIVVAVFREDLVVQQFRIVVGTATALSLVLAACWYYFVFLGSGAVLPCIPWAVFLCHVGLCLLACRVRQTVEWEGLKKIVRTQVTGSVTAQLIVDTTRAPVAWSQDIETSSDVEVVSKSVFESTESRHIQSQNELKYHNEASVKFVLPVELPLHIGAKAAFDAVSRFNYELDSFHRSYSEASSRSRTVTRQRTKVALTPDRGVAVFRVIISFEGSTSDSIVTMPTSEAPASQTFTVDKVEVIDLAPLARRLYDTLAVTIGSTPPRTDSGEWGAYIECGRRARLASEGDAMGAWNTFTDGVRRLWTGKVDSYSWSVTIAAASHTDQSGYMQVRSFLSQVQQITRPSHNDWAWNLVKAVGQ
eukprot:m51a1_g1889 hypothetical protein (441) ;mRNA; f:722955-731359